MLPEMSRPRLRLAVLFVLLAGSLVLLFRPIREPVTRVARWTLIEQPPDEVRCPAPAAGRARWDVQIAGAFPVLVRSVDRSLGATCTADCPAEVTARVEPVWVDEPHFLSGFGRMDIPVVLHRVVGPCRDAFRLSLDVTVDEGIRGSPRQAQLHIGRLVGGFFRNLYDGSSRWPQRRR